MYAHLSGTVEDIGADYLVIECGGVGYRVMVTADTLSYAPGLGEKMKVFTCLVTREDAMELYGFRTTEERRMFERLRSVSGVGAKSAMSVLAALGVQGLSIALAAGDASAIAQAQGIGKKTAQRLILELRDSVTEADLLVAPQRGAPLRAGKGVEAEAIEALMALGYASQEAAQAVSQVSGKAESAGELTRLALKGMGR